MIKYISNCPVCKQENVVLVKTNNPEYDNIEINCSNLSIYLPETVKFPQKMAFEEHLFFEKTKNIRYNCFCGLKYEHPIDKDQREFIISGLTGQKTCELSPIAKDQKEAEDVIKEFKEKQSSKKFHVFRISYEDSGSNGYIVEITKILSEVANNLVKLIKENDLDKLTIQYSGKMTKEEYSNLPDFEGF